MSISITDNKWSDQIALEKLYLDGDLDGYQWQCSAQYNQVAHLLDLPTIPDAEWSTEFMLPQQYQELDVVSYVAERCPSDSVAQQRVAMELEMYIARNLIDVLRTMIYIVDTMRKNQIVWGVGRGSSVSSYVLYLIGVHRIDSLRYNLDIREFLK